MKIIKSKIVIVSIFSFVFFTTIIPSNFDKDSSKQILAAVNGTKIYATDFIQNYEFGFPNLKIGKNINERKQSYLNLMINERILALETKKLNLPLSKTNKKFLRKTKEDLKLQYFIEEEIKSKIKISFDEIKENINKSKVRIKLLLWPENDLENAIIVKSLLEKEGFDNTLKIINSENPNYYISKEHFETDYLEWWQIPTKIFDSVKDLPIGEISEPIKINDLYYLAVVEDIRRISVTEKEYYDKYSTFKKVLIHQKLQNNITNFVDSLLTPMNIKTKKIKFNYLVKLLKNWIESDEDNFALYLKEVLKIKSKNIQYRIMDSAFVEYKGGSISLGTILDYFRFDLLKKEYKMEKIFKIIVNNIITISVRDYLLVRHINKIQYPFKSKIELEYKNWLNKINYLTYKEYLLEEKLDGTFTRIELKKEVEKLITKYKIEINEELLNKLEVNETSKSKNSFYQLYISGTNRLAVPIVDGVWGNN